MATLAVTVAASAASVTIAAPASSWAVDAGGSWFTASNWSDATPPNAADATARFGPILSAPRTVSLNGSATIGTLAFDGGPMYTIDRVGSASLRFLTSDGPARVTADGSRFHAVNVPVSTDVDVRIDVASGAGVRFYSSVDGGSRTLTKTGEGQLTFSGLRTHGLVVEAGEVALAGAYAGPWRFGSLAIDEGAKIDLGGGGDLALEGDPASAAARYAQLRGLIVDRRLTTDEFNATIGLADVSTLPARSIPAGLPPGTVIARAVFAGDADLDWHVTFSDLLALAGNYGKAGTGRWVDGDFDYSGTVDFDDLLTLARYYNKGNWASPGVEALDGSFAADWLLAQSLVPEPAGVVALLGVVGAIVRRRR